MRRLEGIRATGKQALTATAENGDLINITLYFQAATQEWKIDLSSGSFSLTGTRVFSSPNILCQYEDLIPFGLGVITSDGGEPFLINDFSSGRVGLYILSPDEVSQVQDFYVSERDNEG